MSTAESDAELHQVPSERTIYGPAASAPRAPDRAAYSVAHDHDCLGPNRTNHG